MGSHLLGLLLDQAHLAFSKQTNVTVSGLNASLLCEVVHFDGTTLTIQPIVPQETVVRHSGFPGINLKHVGTSLTHAETLGTYLEISGNIGIEMRRKEKFRDQIAVSTEFRNQSERSGNSLHKTENSRTDLKDNKRFRWDQLSRGSCKPRGLN